MHFPFISDYMSDPSKLEPSTAGAIECVVGARGIDYYSKFGLLER